VEGQAVLALLGAAAGSRLTAGLPEGLGVFLTTAALSLGRSGELLLVPGWVAAGSGRVVRLGQRVDSEVCTTRAFLPLLALMTPVSMGFSLSQAGETLRSRGVRRLCRTTLTPRREERR
jgi:hypothetical protein